MHILRLLAHIFFLVPLFVELVYLRLVLLLIRLVHAVFLALHWLLKQLGKLVDLLKFPK